MESEKDGAARRLTIRAAPGHLPTGVVIGYSPPQDEAGEESYRDENVRKLGGRKAPKRLPSIRRTARARKD